MHPFVMGRGLGEADASLVSESGRKKNQKKQWFEEGVVILNIPDTLFFWFKLI